MNLGFRIEVIQQHRRFRYYPAHRWVPGVQNAQRIGMQPPLAVLVQFGAPGFKIGYQPFAVGRTGGAGAERVELQRDLADTKPCLLYTSRCV